MRRTTPSSASASPGISSTDKSATKKRIKKKYPIRIQSFALGRKELFRRLAFDSKKNCLPFDLLHSYVINKIEVLVVTFVATVMLTRYL